MIYNNLGKTNVKVSQISFGTIPILKGPFDILTSYYNLQQSEVDYLVSYAYEKGINLFDTATIGEYADAEEKLGKSIRHIRNNIIVASKSRSYDKESIHTSIEYSLKTLKTDYLDVFFIHQVAPENLEQSIYSEKSALSQLIAMKNKGYIKFVGVATHHISVLNAIKDIKDIDVIQIPCNIVERGFLLETNSIINPDNRFGVFGMKIFAGGALSNHFTSAELLDYTFSQPIIDTSLIGFGSKKHIDDAINALDNFNSNKKCDFEKILYDRVGSILNNQICSRCQSCSNICNVEIHKYLRYRTYYKLGFSDWANRQYSKNPLNGECHNCKKCENICTYGLEIKKLISETVELFK